MWFVCVCVLGGGGGGEGGYQICIGGSNILFQENPYAIWVLSGKLMENPGRVYWQCYFSPPHTQTSFAPQKNCLRCCTISTVHSSACVTVFDGTRRNMANSRKETMLSSETQPWCRSHVMITNKVFLISCLHKSNIMLYKSRSPDHKHSKLYSPRQRRLRNRNQTT